MVSALMSIRTDETKIVGNWIVENGKIVADPAAKRINFLIENELMELARADGGWSVLYLDKTDGRYWELKYPHSGEHGGGAPCLEALSHEDAVEKFKIQG